MYLEPLNKGLLQESRFKKAFDSIGNYYKNPDLKKAFDSIGNYYKNPNLKKHLTQYGIITRIPI